MLIKYTAAMHAIYALYQYKAYIVCPPSSVYLIATFNKFQD